MNAIKRVGCKNLMLYDGGPSGKPGASTQGAVMACVTFDADVSDLFPYINSVAKKSEFHQNPPLVRFEFADRLCVLHANRCLASPFNGREEADRFAENLIVYLNDIADRKPLIQPKHKVFRRSSVTDIIRLLPLTNCQECGFKSCMAFAAAISQQQATPGRCPYLLSTPLNEKAAYPVYDSQGKLIRMVSLDIDTTKTNEELRQTHASLEMLQSQVTELSANRILTEGKANGSLPSPLSTRELQVLRMVASGATNTEISNDLFISPHTVKSHLISIFNKLGVNDRTQASVWAAKQNLV